MAAEPETGGAREELRVEMIGGVKYVNFAPAFSNHNIVKNNIYRIFANHLCNNICLPFGGGEKLVLEEDSYVIPDFLVLCDRNKLKRDGVYGAPDLIAEVISPATVKIDRGEKKELYQRAGVGEYWIFRNTIEWSLKFDA